MGLCGQLWDKKAQCNSSIATEKKQMKLMAIFERNSLSKESERNSKE